LLAAFALVSDCVIDLYSSRVEKSSTWFRQGRIMGRLVPGSKLKWLACLMLVLVAIGGVAWSKRTKLLAWYYVYRLAHADNTAAPTWIKRAAQLETDSVPRLVACLEQSDPSVCANADAALVSMLKSWQGNDAKRSELLHRLAEAFPKLSSGGQQRALDLGASLTAEGQARSGQNSLRSATARLLSAAAPVVDPEVRRHGLKLAKLAAPMGESPELLAGCRDLVGSYLRDGELETRIAAIQLASSPPVNLLDQVALLLRDPAPEIRREAMAAVGSMGDVMATDDLLCWLHDPDPPVRRMCEKALRGRGLRDEHIQLGRLLTDDEAKTRLQVLDYLGRTPELEPGVWLRRLSHDLAPAVRAAAVRAAMEYQQVDIADRLEQIVQNDPSPTVRQLARFYLSCRKAQNN
jgi:HEAT repeat protein